MQTYTLPENYTIECWSEKTRYGFRHLANLRRGGSTVAKDKACYYNRTWECFEFQTVAHGVIDKQFDKAVAADYRRIVDTQGREAVDKMFKSVGAIASLGNLFCDNTADRNKWKRRMLEAGLSGLEFPEDFDSLSEEEKESRINKVIDLALSNS